MLRSVGAIFGGYVLFAVSAVALFGLSGRSPEAVPTGRFLFVCIVYGVVFATAAGWVTARLAPRNPIGHSLLLALMVALGALASFLAAPGSKWSQIVTMFLFAPTVVAGGMIVRRPPPRSL